MCPILYQTLYRTVLQLSVKFYSCCFFLERAGKSSTEDLRSVWRFQGILVERQPGSQGDYERVRSTGSKKIKVLNKLFTSLKKTLLETIGRVLHVDLQKNIMEL